MHKYRPFSQLDGRHNSLSATKTTQNSIRRSVKLQLFKLKIEHDKKLMQSKCIIGRRQYLS